MLNRKEDLNYYKISSEFFELEHVLHDLGFDFESNWLAFKRERLEQNKHLLTPEELAILEEADRRFLVLWRQVKNEEPETPYNKIAKAFLKDIAKIAEKSLKEIHNARCVT